MTMSYNPSQVEDDLFFQAMERIHGGKLGDDRGLYDKTLIAIGTFYNAVQGVVNAIRGKLSKLEMGNR